MSFPSTTYWRDCSFSMYIFASFVKDQRNENQNYNEVSSHTSQNNHNQKKSLLIINAREDMGKENPLILLVRMQLIQSLWRIVWVFLKKKEKTSNKTTIQSSNPTSGHIPWGNQNWKRHMYPYVHWTIICNRKDMKAT